jgi:hypothetical protein
MGWKPIAHNKKNKRASEIKKFRGSFLIRYSKVLTHVVILSETKNLGIDSQMLHLRLSMTS